MLYMDIVRSPYAHAKIKKIDTAKALEDPRRAGGDHRRGPGQVQPALDADAHVRHPDGAADRQGDVPGAGGGGGDRHRAATPPPTASTRSRSSTSRCRWWSIRSRRSSRARRCCAPTRRTRRTTTSGTGRRATGPATDRAFAEADVMVKQDIYLPRIHVASIETCGCVADFDTVAGQAHGLHDHPGAARDPHGVRAGGRPRRPVRGARSASSRPTSAAASAARCRSIRAT